MICPDHARWIAAATLAAITDLSATAQDVQVEIRVGDVLVQRNFGNVAVRPGADSIPSDKDLAQISIADELHQLVLDLDHSDFGERERALDAIVNLPVETAQLYAVLAQSSGSLSAEQRYRMMAAVRERVLNAPRGALGIRMNPRLAMEQREIEVADLLPNLPAKDVLKVGDRIAAIDGKGIEIANDLTTLIQARQPGDVVKLSVRRPKRDNRGVEVRDQNGQILFDELELSITLGSADRLVDPETGRVEPNPYVQETRRQEVAAMEHRFNREPMRLRIAGGVEGLAPSARSNRSSAPTVDRAGLVRRDAPPENPELSDALNAAIIAGDEEAAMNLVEQGAPVNAQGDRGVTALHFAARATMPKLTRLLLEYGADVEAEIERKVLPLHWAVRAGASGREGAEQTIDVLLEYGADINARTQNNLLPISYAIMLGNERMVEFLLERGSMLE